MLVGITGTLVRDRSKDLDTKSPPLDLSNINESAVHEAVLSDEPKEESRADRLSSLKTKIANLSASDSVASVEIEPELVMDEEDASEVSDVEESDLDLQGGEIDLCGSYQEILPAWSPEGLEFEVVEGVRVVYRDIGGSAGADATTGGAVFSNRETVLELPLRIRPVAVKSCIQSDVIGIALDGSLIRNDEYGLYGIFGKDTQIGYALDGFPIYGTNDGVRTDACGGTIDLGEYRYYLSAEREGVLGCYSGVPVKF